MMPHLILEYSSNIETIDFQDLFAKLHQALVDTGAFRMVGIRSRAEKREIYRLADGNPDYTFVHLWVYIREGRPLDIQQQAGENLLQVLKTELAPLYETGH
ncbi:MAG: 5-carboxymethyl-2-hydroxymuconate isomerase, partial [Chloroflexota bacterium]